MNSQNIHVKSTLTGSKNCAQIRSERKQKFVLRNVHRFYSMLSYFLHVNIQKVYINSENIYVNNQNICVNILNIYVNIQNIYINIQNAYVNIPATKQVSVYKKFFVAKFWG